MEGARTGGRGRGSSGRRARGEGKGGPLDTRKLRTAADIARELKRLEAEMYRHARNLEFEQAALLRDQLEQLRQLELDLAALDLRTTEQAAAAAASAPRRLELLRRVALLPVSFPAPVSQARSSVVEHHLDMVVVGGSIPLAPTNSRAQIKGLSDARQG